MRRALLHDPGETPRDLADRLVLILLAALGAPLFALIAVIALRDFIPPGEPGTAVAIEFYRLADMPALIAIPLFTLAGYLLAESQAPRRLVRLTNALFGWLPGGLAIVCDLRVHAVHGIHRRDRRHAGCARRRAVSGADAGAVQRALFARTADRSGSLGLLLVPSMPLILYGVVAQQFHTTPPVAIDALVQGGPAAVPADGRRAVDLQRMAGARVAETAGDEPRGNLGIDQRRGVGIAAAVRRARRHLFRTARRIGSGGGDGAVRTDRHRADPPRN